MLNPSRNASKLGINHLCLLVYKLIRYRPFGVRERYQKLLGEDETDVKYAEGFAELARELGAKKAYIV